MAYQRLWVLLEGNDDERFFEWIIKPIFEERYDFVKSWQYAQKKTKEVKAFLISIKSMGSDYFIWGDINSVPCVNAKKERLLVRYDKILDAENIIVVIREIESWYLAGLDCNSCKKFGIRTFQNTDNTTKEQFNKVIPEKFDSRIDFMIEILKKFSMDTAKQKNKSFGYFMSRI